MQILIIHDILFYKISLFVGCWLSTSFGHQNNAGKN